MTIKEQEDQIFETQMYIADKFRDIQMQANSLKAVEDEDKVKITLTKIVDFCEEIRRGYNTLEELKFVDPVEENNDDEEYNGFNSFFS